MAFRKELQEAVLQNLRHVHSWTGLDVVSSADGHKVISGLPPRRVYVHPDEQMDALEIQRQTGQRPRQDAEFEWVLPLHVDESLSLGTLSGIFDSIMTHPRRLPPRRPASDPELGPGPGLGLGSDWTGERRGKRLLVAVVHSDSTMVYYIMHDSMVKPRQN